MIPDYIIERAANIWSKALFFPIYDNGDKRKEGEFVEALQVINATNAVFKTSDLGKKIYRFNACLISRLTFSQHHQGKDRPAEVIEKEKALGRQYVPEKYMFEKYLTVDYHPCRILSEVAEEVGIPFSLFSIKSEVYIGDYYVRSRFGYTAETHYHYKLPSQDKWLVINSLLSEKDLDVALEVVMDGRLSF